MYQFQGKWILLFFSIYRSYSYDVTISEVHVTFIYMCIFCRPFFSSAEGDLSSVYDTVWYAALFYNHDVYLVFGVNVEDLTSFQKHQPKMTSVRISKEVTHRK